MKIARICATSQNNIFALITQNQWQLGMPEGIARWDGKKWFWVERLDESYTQQLLMRRGKLYILDADGLVRTWKSGISQKQQPPDSRTDVYAAQFSPGIGFRSFAFIDQNTIGVVGDEGAFFILKNRIWRQIETNTRKRLNYISGRVPQCYIVGADATLLRFDGDECRQLRSQTEAMITKIDIGNDGVAFAITAGIEDCLLYMGADDMIVKHSAPAPIFNFSAVSERAIYISTADKVYIWNGLKFESENVKSGFHQMEHARNAVVGVFHDKIYIKAPFWKAVRCKLDIRFLR